MQGCTGSIVSCERSWNGRPRTLRARCPPQLRPRSMASRAFGRRGMGLPERLWSVRCTSTPACVQVGGIGVVLPCSALRCADDHVAMYW